MTKVFVLISGGVDSSVSALLLKKEKYEIVGAHIECFGYCNPKDSEDARLVAEILSIPFYVFDLTEEFEDKVIQYFVRTYAEGLTPNPDVRCNEFLKFGIFFDKALSLGGDFVASGHYARKLEKDGKVYLMSAKDENKDQTYFLWSIKREKLERIIFPIGDYYKKEVRTIAKKHNLPTADKKESMGICFVGTVKLRDFLQKYLKPKEGEIIDINGKILGKHPGYYFFTEGQRHGLNIRVGGGPYYVVGKLKDKNIVVVAPSNHPSLFTKKVYLTEINLLAEELLNSKTNVLARFRHRQPLVPAIFDLEEKSVQFKEPQKMVSPGQSLVMYSKDGIVLGGGIIIKREPEITDFLKLPQ